MATINSVKSGYNKCQINETIEKDANGNVYKRSLMLNIRADKVGEAEELYRDLKSRLNGDMVVLNNRSEKQNGKGPICLCGSPMVKRRGIRGEFYGCKNFPKCTLTKPLKEVVELELVPF